MFIPTCILDSVVTSAWRLYGEGSMVNLISYFGPEKKRPGNEGKGFLIKDSLRHTPPVPRASNARSRSAGQAACSLYGFTDFVWDESASRRPSTRR